MLCQAVLRCFQNPPTGTPCTINGNGTDACFCGTSAAVCFSTMGAANGPCTGPVIAAAKTRIPAQIQQLWTDPGSPLGRANNLGVCRGTNCKSQCAVR